MPDSRVPSCKFCKSSPAMDPDTLEENGFIGYQCTDCRNIYISPLPEQKEVENLYGHDNANLSAQDHLRPSYFKTLHAQHLLGLLKIVKRGGKLLEIGVGGGTFLRAAQASGFDVSGSDYNPIQVGELIRRYGLNCRCGDYKSDFAGEKFDVIVHVDVLSHFRDPVAEFEAMRAMVRDDGILLFQTGNFGDLSPNKRWLVDRWQYPDHLFFFSEQGVKQLTEQTGFDITRLYRYSRSAEFMVGGVLRGVTQLIRGARSAKRSGLKPPASPAAASSAPVSTVAAPVRSGPARIIAAWVGWLYYVLQFDLGRLLPKAGRPQTIVVLCRKKTS